MFKITLCLAILLVVTLASPFQQRIKRQSFIAGVGPSGLQAGFSSYDPYNAYNPYNQYQFQSYNRFNPYQNQYQFGYPGQIGFAGQF
ncbi:hypothetical protein HHI36_000976 [Cryptolaemus montrouzieri]|uniref:Uncharacterized protein n=1 Tax=Cryptolaemus montrouzieri TaxID=559131 RepID=A0ABD2P6F9_9CUCU